MKATSILDGIRIASPCQAGWDAMKGDERARFCSECGKNVYNLSAMTLREASALIAEREGQLCVRLHRRADGTTLTADCPVGSRSVRRGRLRLFGRLGLVGLALASTGVAALGLGRPNHDSYPPGEYATLDDWVDWALIKIGWRKPAMIMGKMVILQGTPVPINPITPPPPAPEDADSCTETRATSQPGALPEIEESIVDQAISP
jgi:hypothetical protein